MNVLGIGIFILMVLSPIFFAIFGNLLTPAV